MNPSGSLTYSEIISQPRVWAASIEYLQGQTSSLRTFYQEGDFSSVIFTGCGSTYYLSLSAAAWFQSLTGKAARGLPASEIWLYEREAYPLQGRHLLVAVSRSGSTTETLRAVEAFKQRGSGQVLTLSCYPDAPLASMGDMNLVLQDAQEESVAQTRAFSTLYLAAVWFSLACADNMKLLEEMTRLPESGKFLIETYAGLANELGREPRLERFYFLGGGGNYGLACEASLKMKEMSLSHSEPFHFMEFRHGPMSMVNEGTLIVGLVSGSNFHQENSVLKEMQARGATVISLGEEDTNVVFRSGLSEPVRAVLYLLPMQLLAYEHSMVKGLNPDLPFNLTAVVHLPDV
jgi:glucosamine--fructose-6-phosphate aminotransferase (isomerizing)